MSRVSVKTCVWFKLRAVEYLSPYSAPPAQQGAALFPDAAMIVEAAKRTFRMYDDDEFLQLFRLDPAFRILTRYTIENVSTSMHHPPQNFDLGLFENPLALPSELIKFNNAIAFVKENERVIVEFFQDDQILDWATRVRQEQIKRQMRTEENERQRLLERELPVFVE